MQRLCLHTHNVSCSVKYGRCADLLLSTCGKLFTSRYPSPCGELAPWPGTVSGARAAGHMGPNELGRGPIIWLRPNSSWASMNARIQKQMKTG